MDHNHLNGKFRGFLPTSQNRHLGTFERLAEELSPGPTLDEETAKALAEATLRHIREVSPTAAFIREMVSRHPKQCAAFQDYVQRVGPTGTDKAEGGVWYWEMVESIEMADMSDVLKWLSATPIDDEERHDVSWASFIADRKQRFGDA
ncbi:hypothetical protein FIBSPDRAFT_861919 [Athelia psychrophila]|uniref:Uncharacterized protein n=1 Tax=Athelia psychrophila TaxID=1759441 RepID=A0A166ISJ9_9AGAM|nr:hypothetical protein FIBSPDRAFT_861919 [Fibularhizoctonia sp. CBS 109695]